MSCNVEKSTTVSVSLEQQKKKKKKPTKNKKKKDKKRIQIKLNYLFIQKCSIYDVYIRKFRGGDKKSSHIWQCY